MPRGSLKVLRQVFSSNCLKDTYLLRIFFIERSSIMCAFLARRSVTISAIAAEVFCSNIACMVSSLKAGLLGSNKGFFLERYAIKLGTRKGCIWEARPNLIDWLPKFRTRQSEPFSEMFRKFISVESSFSSSFRRLSI